MTDWSNEPNDDEPQIDHAETPELPEVPDVPEIPESEMPVVVQVPPAPPAPEPPAPEPPAWAPPPPPPVPPTAEGYGIPLRYHLPEPPPVPAPEDVERLSAPTSWLDPPPAPQPQSGPADEPPASVPDDQVPLTNEGSGIVASPEPTDWLQPPPLEPAPIVDAPVYERTEPEIIDVPASEDVEEVIEEADEDEDEIVFDLASLSTEERRHLSMRLTGAGIAHIWEVATDLVVSVADAPVIESYIQEVRNPDGFADEELANFDADEDVDDEAVYAAMSDLFVAADKLMQKPADEPTIGAFYLAADGVEGLPAPFGFDPRVWSQVLGLTDAIVTALDAEAASEPIGADAASLRQLLASYV